MRTCSKLLAAALLSCAALAAAPAAAKAQSPCDTLRAGGVPPLTSLDEAGDAIRAAAPRQKDEFERTDVHRARETARAEAFLAANPFFAIRERLQLTALRYDADREVMTVTSRLFDSDVPIAHAFQVPSDRARAIKAPQRDLALIYVVSPSFPFLRGGPLPTPGGASFSVSRRCVALVDEKTGEILWSDIPAAAAQPAAPSVSAAPSAPPAAPARRSDLFQCMGPYSNVSFSNESGDGSGVLVRVGEDGRVALDIWEGDSVSANVLVTGTAPTRLDLRVGFPGEAAFPATLHCEAGALRLVSENWGSLALRQLTQRQAAQLTGSSR